MSVSPAIEYALSLWAPLAAVVCGLLYFERRLSRMEATLKLVAARVLKLDQEDLTYE